MADEEKKEINTEEQDISKLIYIAQMLSNDLKHIQFHAIGPYFDNIQNITKELHNELECEIDELMIEAMTQGLPIHNFNDIKSYLGEEEYQPLESEMFDWDVFCAELSERGGKYLKALCDSSLPGAIKNPYISFWNKEINFKTSLRALDLNPTCEENEQVEHSVLEPYFLSDGLPQNEIDDPNEPLPAVNWKDLAKSASWGSDVASLEKNETENAQDATDDDKDDDKDDAREESPDENKKEELKENIIKPNYKKFYHGSKAGKIDKLYKNYDSFFITTSFAYAAMFSNLDTDNEPGCVFEVTPKRDLNIFDARDEGAIEKLKQELMKQKPDSVGYINFEKLKTSDWNDACGGREDIRDSVLVPVIKSLGYDGFINLEWGDCGYCYADGEGGAGYLSNIEIEALAIFDIENLNITSQINYDEYFFDDIFNKCHKYDLDVLYNVIPDYEGESDELLEYCSENLPFLHVDEITDEIEYAENESAQEEEVEEYFTGSDLASLFQKSSYGTEIELNEELKPKEKGEDPYYIITADTETDDFRNAENIDINIFNTGAILQVDRESTEDVETFLDRVAKTLNRVISNTRN
jgi:hypothetical protein